MLQKTYLIFELYSSQVKTSVRWNGGHFYEVEEGESEWKGHDDAMPRDGRVKTRASGKSRGFTGPCLDSSTEMEISFHSL